MNFNFPLLKPIRILLLPFSVIYALILSIRNWLFDAHIFQSASFNLPIICIGNLSAGGTGKSPMVEWLIKRMQDKFPIAILSRGYKRKTAGYALADAKSTALDIGDEPMQFHEKFPKVTVAVGEERVVAIPQLLHDRPSTRVIILDDAFQHRYVKAGLNLLLTDFNNLYTRDWFLPTGDLRDEKRSSRRADLIIVTKCDRNLTPEKRDDIVRELKPLRHQHVFFSAIRYGTPYHITSRISQPINDSLEVLLVCGIANPIAIKKYLNDRAKTYYEMSFRDHHIYTILDLKAIMKRFNGISDGNKMIVTTEKDAVRLRKFEHEIQGLPIYVMPIEISFLFGGEQQLNDIIVKFITDFNHQP